MLADLRLAISRVGVRDLEATFRFSYKWEGASQIPGYGRRRLGFILQDMLVPPLVSLVTLLFALSALPALAFPASTVHEIPLSSPARMRKGRLI